MDKRCLIIYSSFTKNTEKIAMRIKETFEKKGWSCDSFNVEKNIDVENPPFNYDDYDFICAGSVP